MNIRENITEKLRTLPDWAVLALLMLFALAVRLIYLWGHPLESRDGIGYIRFVQDWYERGAAALPDFLSTKPPLFCYLSRSLMYLGVDVQSATLAVSLAAGVLVLIPIYISGRALWKERAAAVWLCALASVLPVFVRYSCLRLREGLYLLSTFSVVCAWILAMKRIHMFRSAAVCGFLAVIALLCRYEAAELLFCGALTLPFAALFPGWRWKAAGRMVLAYGAGVVFGIALILMLPGMPNMWAIYFNRVWSHCLGTFINPL